MVRRAKGKKAARAKGKIKAKLRRAKSAAKRRPKKTAIRTKRKSVAGKQARSKSKAKRAPARPNKKDATGGGERRPPTVGPVPASRAGSKPEPTGPASALSGRAGPRHPAVDLDEYR